jgi:hypothetical protein
MRTGGLVTTMIRLAALALCIGACGQSSPGQSGGIQAPSLEDADSLVLEHGACPSCAEYRLSVARSGRVQFQLRDYDGEDVTVTDSVSPSAFLWLLNEAERTGIVRLPAFVQNDDGLCPAYATNHPVVILSIHAAAGVIQVVHNTGCVHVDGRSHWRPHQLEAAIVTYARGRRAFAAARNDETGAGCLEPWP